MDENPLLCPFSLPFGAIPFREIRLEHFTPAFERAFTEARARVEAISQCAAPPNLTNTAVALEESVHFLNLLSNIFFNLHAANSSQKSQALAKEISVQRAAFENDIWLHKGLFERISVLQTSISVQKKRSVSAVDKKLVQHYYDHFLRNGAHLQTKEKRRLRDIDQRLAHLSQLFSEHLLKATDEYELLLTKATDLDGLPENVSNLARKAAQTQGKEGWSFTLRAPSYLPFMQYASNRALREQLYRAYNSRAQADPVDNRPILKEIVQLRHQRAQLLGYSTHADYVLEKRMAANPKTVHRFLHDLQDSTLPFAKKELKKLANYAKKRGGIARLERWDALFYMEKYKQEQLALDDEQLRPYFPCEASLQGFFKVAERLYDIRFIEQTNLPTYHQDARVFEVRDGTDTHLALLYVDLFSRPGKRNGAWMTVFQDQYHSQAKDHRPHVSIVCNFAQGQDESPALLTFSDVETLFHECGHALHGIFSEVAYASLSGTSVDWDFVELPSQLMEAFLYEEECLLLFARHYQTSAPLPSKYIKRIQELKRFMAGFLTIRQLVFAQIDLAWHENPPEKLGSISISDFEKEAIKSLELLPSVENTSVSPAFAHIFSGGYSAGYYSYKWAEVMAADAFDFFVSDQKTFDQKIALHFRREILSKGGTLPADALYRNFRGQNPDTKAFLRRTGMIST